jgi:hypothetical protein
MMAVASKLAPYLLLAAALVGCEGDVVDGLARDGGAVADDDQAAGRTRDGGSRDGGMLVRDATVADSGSRDAGANSPPRQDAATPQTDAGAPSSGGGGDAGTSSTALNPGFLARPSNGRQFTPNLADWMGNPRCTQDQVLFCDDFEGATAGGAPGENWVVQGDGVSASDDQPLRGSKSVRYSPPSGMPGQMELKTFPMVQNKMFGRVFVYFFTDAPTSPSNAHWTLVQVGGGDSNAQVRLGGQVDPSRGGKTFFGVGSDGGDTGDWHTHGLEPESEVKKGTWTCLEWMFDGDANETRVWINNVEQLSLHTTAANYRVGDVEGGAQFIHPTYSYLKLGYWVYQADTQPNPAVLFLDEVIIDDEQIGCSR